MAQNYLPILGANMTQLIIHKIQMGLHELGEHSFGFFLEMQEWLKFDTNSPILQMSQLDDLFHTSTTKQFMQIFGGCFIHELVRWTLDVFFLP
jgi:hypothetical protein